jgi:hypothetical protein
LKTQKGTKQWRIPFAIQLVPAGVSLRLTHREIREADFSLIQLAIVMLVFLCETPRFSAYHHGETKGK